MKSEDLAHLPMDVILDGVYHNESRSGSNKRAYLPNKEGSIGGYQIKKGTFDIVKSMFPEKYSNVDYGQVARNDAVGRTVAGDYLSLNKQYLVKKGFTPTTELLLASYNAGPGIFKTNTRVGPQVQAYIDSAMGHINSKRKR